MWPRLEDSMPSPQINVPIWHVSLVGHPFQTRAFHKQCVSLAQAGYEVHLINCHSQDQVIQGVHVHTLPKAPSRLKRMLYWPWMAYHRIRELQPPPALCHLHEPETLPIAQALRLQGYKVIYDVHENTSGQIRHKPYLPKALAVTIAWAYRGVESCLTSGIPTLHVLESIARNYRHPHETVRNLPALGTVPDTVVRSENGPIRLIYVGGIARDRGAFRMIELARRLSDRGLDFRLQIIGPFFEPCLEHQMRTRISQDHLDSKVCLLGELTYDKAMLEIANAHIGLCLLDPTPNYLNSLATKILEYMQFGLPVVASDFECWREYVADTGSGVQVNVNCLDEIVDKIEWLIKDSKVRGQMACAGRIAVRNRYCWDREKSKLFAFYERVLRCASRPSSSPMSTRHTCQSTN